MHHDIFAPTPADRAAAARLSDAEIRELRETIALMLQFLARFRAVRPDFAVMIAEIEGIAEALEGSSAESFRAGARALRDLMGSLDGVSSRFDFLAREH